MEYRVCRICSNEKELSERFFYKRGSGFRWECRLCALQNRKEHYPEIKEERADYIRQYYRENKETILEQNKNYIAENQEQRTAYLHTYYQNNKNEIIDKNHTRHKIRRKEDPAYRLRKDLSTRIYAELKKVGGSKNGESILKHFLYSIQELKEHLENQFETWMTWENQGKYNAATWKDDDITTWTWQLDHIIPQANLPYTSMEDDNFKKCWALSNLRPLSAKQNVIDGNRR
jgi:hypothetical protein